MPKALADRSVAPTPVLSELRSACPSFRVQREGKMLEISVLTEEEKVVDPRLGYPHGYVKLCRNPAAQLSGLITPFSDGPPRRFLPYTPQAQDLKEWDDLFPAVVEAEREPPNAHNHAEELWLQLDHLGNAGFDPAKFRVDAYGNVVYWNADPSSPLAWEVDHWFPHTRGGQTVVSNLQVVQWQAHQRKKNRLEFLVPWWDLQHGVSINQFLSAFAAKDANFRRRSFALFFAGGEDEKVVKQHVGDCRPWPSQFRESKAQCGLAAAAIVYLSADMENARKVVPKSAIVNSDLQAGTMAARQGWSAEEEEALRHAVQRFGPGSWKEIKQSEPALVNRTTVQIKDKYRLMRGDWHFGKENNRSAPKPNGRGEYDRQTSALQKELRLKIMREEEKREKEEEIAQLEETVRTLKQQNERERVALLDLEGVLTKHRQRVEKQRRWAETQSSYRLCLERMIRDTMHQSISYKEQARLNQAACNALMARLDCQKMTCETAEKDLLQRYSHREALAVLAQPDLTETDQKRLRGRDIVDVSSCLSQALTPEKIFFPKDGDSGHCSESDDGEPDEVYSLRMQHRWSKDLIQQEKQQVVPECLDDDGIQDGSQEVEAKGPAAVLESQVLGKVEQSLIAPVAPERDSDCEVGYEGQISSSTNQESEVRGIVQGRVRSAMRARSLPVPTRRVKRNSTRKSEVGYEGQISSSTNQESEVRGIVQGRVRSAMRARSLPVPTRRVKRNSTRKSEVGYEGQISSSTNQESEDGEREGDIAASKLCCDSIKVHDSQGMKVAKAGASDGREGQRGKSLVGDNNDLDVVLLGHEYESNGRPPSAVGNKPLSKASDALLDCKQKDVIMVETQSPNVSGIGVDVGPPLQEEHLDELLQEVLTTHVEQVRRAEAAAEEATNIDDEKLREIGKLNLDKWLHVLLHKENEIDSNDATPSPQSPLHAALSPALSTLSMAAVRGSMELYEGHDHEFGKTNGVEERPKRGWGALLRKLSVRHQSDQSFSKQIDFDSDEETLEPQTENGKDIRGVLKSLGNFRSNNSNPQNLEAVSFEGTEPENRASATESAINIPESVKNWPEGGMNSRGVASQYWQKETANEAEIFTDLEPALSEEDATYVLDSNIQKPSPMSVAEDDETESLNSCNQDGHFQVMEGKDLAKNGLRASFKACTLKWKRVVKKLDVRLQEGGIPLN